MQTEYRLLLWWLLFAATHVLGSSVPVRTRLLRRLGLRGFKAAYSLVALATFVPLVTTYWHDRHAGAVLFDPPRAMRHVTEVLMLFAVLFLVLAFASPNPGTTSAEMSGRRANEPRGIHRVTRHPMNTAFALFGLAHVASNPTVGDWIFFGGFVVYAVASAWHQDRRLLASGPPEYREFHAATSFLPLGAVLAGRQRIAWREFPPVAVLVAVLLFVALRLVHPLWIGGFAS